MVYEYRSSIYRNVELALPSYGDISLIELYHVARLILLPKSGTQLARV